MLTMPANRGCPAAAILVLTLAERLGTAKITPAGRGRLIHRRDILQTGNNAVRSKATPAAAPRKKQIAQTLAQA